MREDGLTDGAGPHPERRRQASCLRMGRHVLPQGPLVDVLLATDRTRVVRRPTLGCNREWAEMLDYATCACVGGCRRTGGNS